MPAKASIYAATPAIQIDGQAQTALTSNLLELFSEETQEGLARCEATFTNWGSKNNAVGYLYSDRQIIDFGKPFKVEARDAQGVIFDGRVMGLEGRYARERPPELMVLAEDRLQDLRMTRRTRTFEEISDSDLFQQVASAHGLQTEIDVDGPTHRVLAQLNQSDLAFLRERARAVDAELWIEDSTLKVKARSRRDESPAEGLTLTYLRDLLECSILADLACQYSHFRATGWNADSKEAVEFEASSSAISGELGSDTGGASELQRALGDRKQQIVHRLPVNSDEAQSLAEGEYRRMARRFLKGSCLAEGDARIRVGVFVELDGLGPMFDGRYYVTRVRHMFTTRDGYRTAFNVERPGLQAT